MEDGLNGKNGAPVLRHVTWAPGTGYEVVPDRNRKNLDDNAWESLCRQIFVTLDPAKVCKQLITIIWYNNINIKTTIEILWGVGHVVCTASIGTYCSAYNYF